MAESDNFRFVFFGTSEFSVFVLDELEKAGFLPSLVVTAPDTPQGRKLILTPSPVKLWAKERKIPILQPEKLDDNFIYSLRSTNYVLFIVASYGKIIPKAILDIPEKGALNVHPSLLPQWRGASPIQTTILEDDQMTGVTIMLMDEKMDHGPIVAQEIYEPEEWPPKASELEETLARLGGKLLSEVMPEWISGNIDAQNQEHELATFTKKIKKDDAEISLKDDPYQNLLKIKAYEEWPRAYFFANPPEGKGKKIRIVVTEAHIENDELVLDKVIPEGKKEMSWEDFQRNL